jgi:hypothetical protein
MSSPTRAAALRLAAVLAAMFFALGGIAQDARDPSVHRPVSAEELERLKRRIVEQTRSSVEMLSEYHTESGDLNNRLDFWRLGARLNLKWREDSLVYLSGVQTNYTTRDVRFSAWGMNVTLGLRRELSEDLRVQLELGGTSFSTDTNSINGLASLTYAPSDLGNVYLTASRSNVEESLLSATGVRPTTGPFAGTLVGRVMENKGLAGGAVKLPFKFDAFAEAGLGTRQGSSVARNEFKTARAGAGYEILSRVEDRALSFVRVAYVWHYFAFDENRLGYGGASLLASDGRPVEPGLLGSDGISPVPAPGHPGVGGYFSPEHFVSRTGRIDLAGRMAPGRTYRASAFFGEQVFTDSPKRSVYGASLTLDYVLSDHITIPVTFLWDNLGPFNQLMLALKLVVKL